VHNAKRIISSCIKKKKEYTKGTLRDCWKDALLRRCRAVARNVSCGILQLVTTTVSFSLALPHTFTLAPFHTFSLFLAPSSLQGLDSPRRAFPSSARTFPSSLSAATAMESNRFLLVAAAAAAFQNTNAPMHSSWEKEKERGREERKR